jgi:hypothetical protein
VSDIFGDDDYDNRLWRDERPKQRSFSEDEAEAEAYFKQYVTSSFHPDDKMADNKIRVIYPLVNPPAAITTLTVPALSAQERQSATMVRDHQRNRYKARFWPLYARSYHKAKKACQTETTFRMSLTRDDVTKLGFHDVNAYTYDRRIWPTQLGGQLWGMRDAFLPANQIPFDHKMRTSIDVSRHSRPSSSYNRRGDPTESALRALPYGTWPIPGEFYRDYIAAWLGPLLEFTFAHQRCVNAWIIAQYGLTHQEVEGVPELDWLRTLMSRGCPLDVFAYLVEHENPDTLLQLVKRRPASEDELSAGTFSFEFAASHINQMLSRWEMLRWPNGAEIFATLPNSFHFIRSDDYASQTRRYAFPGSYHQNDERAYVFKERSGESRPIVSNIYVAGFDGNGQFQTGLADQRETTEQRSAIRRPLIEGSVQRADLSALHTPRPHATLGAYRDSRQSMPTPYGLV